MNDWHDPVGYMVDAFGQNEEMLTILLEFLQVLPEEMYCNRRLCLDVYVIHNRLKPLTREKQCSRPIQQN
jgi:Exportin 1-like protein